MDNQMNPSSSAPPKLAIQHKKITWPDEPSMPQNFSLPSSIIYYISKNPSNPAVYLKLAQSCKYFFEKLPLLVAKDFYGEDQICAFAEKECHKITEYDCCVDIDLSRISSKLWLTNELKIDDKYENHFFTSLLSSKLYKSDIASLEIVDQEVLFDDFKLIASTAKDILVYNFKMLDSDGNPVKLDALLEAIPNVKKLVCKSDLPIFDSSTVKNMAKLKKLSNLRYFDLYDVSEIANVEHFLNFLKAYPEAKTLLEFVKNISKNFKKRLDVLVDAVFKDKLENCLINYVGQDDEKLEYMQCCYCSR